MPAEAKDFVLCMFGDKGDIQGVIDTTRLSNPNRIHGRTELLREISLVLSKDCIFETLL